MKFRKGFVTNSSSSSFIMGKKEDEVTIDLVFSKIKQYYEEYIKICDEMITYCEQKHKKNKRYPYYDKKKHCLKLDGGFIKLDETIKKELKDKFEIPLYEVYKIDVDWLSCNSYKEYENFCIQKILESKDDYYLVPFSIASLDNPNPILLHYHKTRPEEDSYMFESVIEWYTNKDDDLNIQDLDIINQLGKICIYSECGYMPEYVVKKLSKISNFYCNHMG